MAAEEKRASEIADGGYDYSEVVAAVPETIVGRLISEDLVCISRTQLMGRRRGFTSMRPTTIERLGI